MNLWLLFGGLLGGLVFTGVIFWAFRMPDGEILRLSVRGEKIEYQLWQAERRCSWGTQRCGAGGLPARPRGCGDLPSVHASASLDPVFARGLQKRRGVLY